MRSFKTMHGGVTYLICDDRRSFAQADFDESWDVFGEDAVEVLLVLEARDDDETC